MKKYIEPEFKIELFDTEDIITASSGSTITPDIDGGSTTFLEEWIKSWTESEENQ